MFGPPGFGYFPPDPTAPPRSYRAPGAPAPGRPARARRWLRGGRVGVARRVQATGSSRFSLHRAQTRPGNAPGPRHARRARGAWRVWRIVPRPPGRGGRAPARRSPGAPRRATCVNPLIARQCNRGQTTSSTPDRSTARVQSPPGRGRGHTRDTSELRVNQLTQHRTPSGIACAVVVPRHAEPRAAVHHPSEAADPHLLEPRHQVPTTTHV